MNDTRIIQDETTSLIIERGKRGTETYEGFMLYFDDEADARNTKRRIITAAQPWDYARAIFNSNDQKARR